MIQATNLKRMTGATGAGAAGFLVSERIVGTHHAFHSLGDLFKTCSVDTLLSYASCAQSLSPIAVGGACFFAVMLWHTWVPPAVQLLSRFSPWKRPAALIENPPSAPIDILRFHPPQPQQGAAHTILIRGSHNDVTITRTTTYVIQPQGAEAIVQASANENQQHICRRAALCVVTKLGKPACTAVCERGGYALP